MASRTRQRSTRGGGRDQRPGKEINPWRDHWVILAVPKPFAKMRRRWRRAKRRAQTAIGVSFWLAIGAVVLYTVVMH